MTLPTPEQGGDRSKRDNPYLDHLFSMEIQDMIDSRHMRFGLLLLASTALAGCLGDSNGTASTSGATSVSPYQAEFDRVSAIAPTSDMPTAIQATYAGQMRADVSEGSAVVGEIVADLNLDVDWTDGQTANPFTGSASNFQGRLSGGDFEAIDGTLSVDPAFAGTIARTVIPGGTFGGVTIPEVQTGAMNVTLSGQLTQGTDTADTTVGLGGNFLGSGASAAVGAVSGGFSNAAAPGPSIFDGAIGGTYYLERQ